MVMAFDHRLSIIDFRITRTKNIDRPTKDHVIQRFMKSLFYFWRIFRNFLRAKCSQWKY